MTYQGPFWVLVGGSVRQHTTGETFAELARARARAIHLGKHTGHRYVILDRDGLVVPDDYVESVG